MVLYLDCAICTKKRDDEKYFPNLLTFEYQGDIIMSVWDMVPVKTK